MNLNFSFTFDQIFLKKHCLSLLYKQNAKKFLFFFFSYIFSYVQTVSTKTSNHQSYQIFTIVNGCFFVITLLLSHNSALCLREIEVRNFSIRLVFRIMFVWIFVHIRSRIIFGENKGILVFVLNTHCGYYVELNCLTHCRTQFLI